RLFPQALLPMRDREATLKEVRRCVEDLHLTGFTVSDNLSAQDLPEYNEPFWQPFWELVNELEVPLNFHIGGTVIDARPAIWKTYSYRETTAIATTMFELSNAITLDNFLMSGLLDKYPNVKLVSV